MKLRLDEFVSMEEDLRKEFVEFVPDKVMEELLLVDATVENVRSIDVSIRPIESITQEIMLYLFPADVDKNCIKKIHRL
ncbi:MAG: hypothetical protein L0H53_13415 [Candidatus Nitrosocosmicus sp.]|nr:hypothetical protein [Candidatus Nitrosocosmicus sp.]